MRRLKALTGLLLHAVAHNAFESGSDGTSFNCKFWRIFVQDGRHRLGAGVALECALAVQHLVKNAAETEDVGPVIGGIALHLLR